MIKECDFIKCSNTFDDDFFHDGRPRTQGPRRRFCSKECQRSFVCSAEQQRRHALKRKYGLTLEQYNQMLEQQDYRCAICNRHEDTVRKKTGVRFTLAVDHDHSTGLVRGLLCTPCNRGIGFLRDDPELLEAAANYLRACN